jgi:5-methylcytosine-specific restriction endonuclease McrA
MGKCATIKPRGATLPTRGRFIPKVAESFYQSKAWRQLIVSIKRERGNFCQECGSSHRVIGDHIIERKDGGADLDRQNIKLLCQPCHNTKTANARAARSKGIF